MTGLRGQAPAGVKAKDVERAVGRYMPHVRDFKPKAKRSLSQQFSSIRLMLLFASPRLASAQRHLYIHRDVVAERLCPGFANLVGG